MKSSILTKTPDRLQTRLEKEREVIRKTAEAARKKEAEPDFYQIYSDQLVKLSNPIQIWIRSTIFQEIGLDAVAELYRQKSAELGYNPLSVNEKQEWHSGKIHTYKSVNGHTCIEALDAETSKALDQFFINFASKDRSVTESVEIFQYKPETINGIINLNLYADVNYSDSEFDEVAVMYLINSDPVLKFLFYTPEGSMDIREFYKRHIKGDQDQLKALKQFEKLAVKAHLSGNKTSPACQALLEACPSTGLVQFSRFGKSLDKDLVMLTERFNSLPIEQKIDIRNSLYDLNWKDLGKGVYGCQTSANEALEIVIERLSRMTSWSKRVNSWIVECLTVAIQSGLPISENYGEEMSSLVYVGAAWLAIQSCQ